MSETLVAVYCANQFCPEAVRSGGRRRELIARATPGAVLELRCAKCRQVHVYRVREAAAMAH